MATITIGATSTPVTGSKNYTISDADMTRLLNAMKVILVRSLPESPTNSQIMNAWGDWFIERTKMAVKDYEAKASPPGDIVIS